MPIRRDRNRCPSCGERVTPYAAGCALCGADLDPRRSHRGPGAMSRLGSGFAAFTHGPRRGGSCQRTLPWPLNCLVAGVVLSLISGLGYAVLIALAAFF
jgi:hypothetical protein